MRAVFQKERCRDGRGYCAYFTGLPNPCHWCAVTAQSYTIGKEQRQHSAMPPVREHPSRGARLRIRGSRLDWGSSR
jgi:hypothetical protein